MKMDAEYINSVEFWKDEGFFVAGDWEGMMPDLGKVRQPVLFKTSGSMGNAKWIVLEKQALLISATAVNRWLDVSHKSKWGLALPLNHVGGFGVVARTYEASCELAVFPGKWDPAEYAEWVAREQITHTSLVPTQVYDLIRAGLRGADSLKAVVVGGGRLSPKLGQAARDAGWPVLASYGMTETCSQIATQEIDLVNAPFVDSPLEVLPMWSAEASTSGLLRLKGDALFSGIVEKKDGAWEFSARQGRWFATRDRVSLAGKVLIPEGRADLLVKVMGELVDVEKVERRFLRVCGDLVSATGFAVVPVTDGRKGNALIAVCEEGEGLTEEMFQEYNLSATGVERLDQWWRLESLPKTELGKLKRAELKDLCEARLAAEQPSWRTPA